MGRIITPCDEDGHDFKGDNFKVLFEPEQQRDGTWWQVKEPLCNVCGAPMGIRFPIKQVRKLDGSIALPEMLKGILKTSGQSN